MPPSRRRWSCVRLAPRCSDTTPIYAGALAAVLGVGLATGSFAALPTVRQKGPATSVLFILLRLVQGMFVGGADK